MAARSMAIAVLLALLACTPRSTGDRDEQRPAPEPAAVAYPDEPLAELPTLEPGRSYPIELLGELFLSPLGYGGRFVTASGEALSLASAGPEQLGLHGRRVRASGRVWICGTQRVFNPVEIELLPGQSPELAVELPPPPLVHGKTQIAELRSPWFRVVADVWMASPNRAWLRLDDGSLLRVDIDALVELDVRVGQRVSLILARGEVPSVIGGCVGEHERCGPAPEIHHTASFTPEQCVRHEQLGLGPT